MWVPSYPLHVNISNSNIKLFISPKANSISMYHESYFTYLSKVNVHTLDGTYVQSSYTGIKDIHTHNIFLATKINNLYILNLDNILRWCYLELSVNGQLKIELFNKADVDMVFSPKCKSWQTNKCDPIHLIHRINDKLV